MREGLINLVENVACEELEASIGFESILRDKTLLMQRRADLGRWR